MIRALAPADLAFVRSPWLRSYSDSDWARFVTPPDYWEAHKDPSTGRGHGGATYYEGQRALIERLLVESVVLVDQADDGRLRGWICGWPRTTLHYLYVRQSERGRGVARGLLAALDLRRGEPVTYTHRAAGIRGQPRGWRFDKGSLMLREAPTMAKHRIKYLQFVDNNSVPLHKGESGQVEQLEHFRAEQDRIWAEFNDATGLIVIRDRDPRTGGVEDHVVHVSRCRRLKLYPAGEVPSWEKPEAAKGAAA